jgi:hypothetical protein
MSAHSNVAAKTLHQKGNLKYTYGGGNTRRERNHSGMCAATIERKGICGIVNEIITNLNTMVVIIAAPLTLN